MLTRKGDSAGLFWQEQWRRSIAGKQAGMVGNTYLSRMMSPFLMANWVISAVLCRSSFSMRLLR